MKLTRTVTKEECPWLDKDLPEGTEVFEYTGHTYGVCQELAVTFKESGELPFFEIPYDSVSE